MSRVDVLGCWHNISASTFSYLTASLRNFTPVAYVANVLTPFVKISGTAGRCVSPVLEIWDNNRKSHLAELSPPCQVLQNRCQQFLRDHQVEDVQIKETANVSNIEISGLVERFVTVNTDIVVSAQNHPSFFHVLSFCLKREIVRLKNNDMLKMPLILAIIAIASLYLAPMLGSPLGILALSVNFIFFIARPVISYYMEYRADDEAIANLMKLNEDKADKELIGGIHFLFAKEAAEQNIYATLSTYDKIKYYIHQYFLLMTGSIQPSNKSRLDKLNHALTYRNNHKRRNFVLVLNRKLIQQISEKFFHHTIVMTSSLDLSKLFQMHTASTYFSKPLKFFFQFGKKLRELRAGS